MNKEKDLKHLTEASMVEELIEKVTRKEMAIAIKATKPGKVAGPSEVCAEMIFTSGEVEISVMMEFCQHELNEKEYRMNGKQVCW